MEVTAPATTAERCAIARRFKTDYKVTLPILVDGVDDDFERAMSPWPLRFYVVDLEGKMGFIAQPQACSYELSGLRDYLLNC